MKKRILLFSFVAAGIALISLAQDRPEQKDPAQAEVQGLRDEVADLRTRIQVLEERMKKVETTVDKSRQSPLPTPLSGPREKLLLPKTSSDTGESPKIWGERKVNGWTFYIVPCEQQQGR
jgi:hypothetical protein